MSEEHQTLWSALSHDLAKLDSLKFPRFVTSEDSPAYFYIFCDTSKGVCSFQLIVCKMVSPTWHLQKLRSHL